MAQFVAALKSWVSATFTPLSDVRLADARTPTVHAASHATAGTDAITPAAIGAEAAGTAATAVANHLAAGDPHPTYVTAAEASELGALAAPVQSVAGRTGAVTLAAADVSGVAAAASNLSDLASAATARTNLGLGDSATRSVGTAAGTVMAGDDSRYVPKAGAAGFPARDGAGATNSRTLTGGTGITVTNGSGASGDPTISVTPGLYAPRVGLYLPGVSGTFVSAPDSAALSVTGDIDIRALIAPANWVLGDYQTIVTKGEATGFRSYCFRLSAENMLTLLISADGTALATYTSTVAPTGVAWTPLWVRATLVLTDGVNSRCNFYTSADGVTWTLLGTEIVTTPLAGIYDNARVVRIGYSLLDTYPLAGLVLAVEIRAGIGTIAGAWNGRTPHTRQRDSAGNIWTVGGTANAWQVA